MVNQNNKVELFPCYSFQLKDFLVKNGIAYKLVGLHPQTKKQFFVFIDDDEVKKLINEWEKIKLKNI
jgi:hypothetical protein